VQHELALLHHKHEGEERIPDAEGQIERLLGGQSLELEEGACPVQDHLRVLSHSQHQTDGPETPDRGGCQHAQRGDRHYELPAA